MVNFDRAIGPADDSPFANPFLISRAPYKIALEDEEQAVLIV